MVESKPTIKAVANIKKNRLNLTLQGNIDTKALEKLYTEIRFCVADLKQGFEVVSDISQCNLIYITGLPIYKKIIDYLITNKVGQIIRITRNENVSCKQILNFTEQIQCYKALQAENKDEAEKKLESLKKRKGIRFRLKKIFFEYETDQGIGKGSIIDISTSGCAVESPTLSLPEASEITISLKFDQHDTLPSSFRIKAKIVRTNERMFAAHFLDLDDDHEDQLYKRLAYEVSHSTFLP